MLEDGVYVATALLLLHLRLKRYQSDVQSPSRWMHGVTEIAERTPDTHAVNHVVPDEPVTPRDTIPLLLVAADGFL